MLYPLLRQQQHRTRTSALKAIRAHYSSLLVSDFKNKINHTTNTGVDILHDSFLNKGTAFSKTERDRLFLRGLLPPRVKDMELQLQRLRLTFDVLEDDIEKYHYLNQLQNRNETLFFRFIIDNLRETTPVIYTPTIGRACLEYSAKFRHTRGMFFSAEDRGEMTVMAYNYPVQDVDVVVVTDGGRVLGLGDLGANGMGIPVGKLSLYVAAGGFHPGRVLPIMLDVGTNNAELRDSPFYLGIDRERMEGEEYMEVMSEFLEAITTRYPNVLIQFEDLHPPVAASVLEKFRDKYLCFNDDIQGTGAVVVSGVLNALRAKGQNFSDIQKQKIVLVGGGSAGLGVANALCRAMRQEGLSEEEALKNIYIVDVNGLIASGRESLLNGQERFGTVRTDLSDGMPLVDVIKNVKPDVLLGISGQGGLFNDAVLQAMADGSERPIILPLSNPTIKSECTATQAYNITKGKCIFASGSPFGTVKYEDKVFTTTQCNNMFIFPGVGYAANLSGAKRISDEVFYVASKALASCVTDEELAKGEVYPDVDNIREVSVKVASAVIRQIVSEGHATKRHRLDMQNLDKFVRSSMWVPEYEPIVLNNPE